MQLYNSTASGPSDGIGIPGTLGWTNRVTIVVDNVLIYPFWDAAVFSGSSPVNDATNSVISIKNVTEIFDYRAGIPAQYTNVINGGQTSHGFFFKAGNVLLSASHIITLSWPTNEFYYGIEINGNTNALVAYINPVLQDIPTNTSGNSYYLFYTASETTAGSVWFQGHPYDETYMQQGTKIVNTMHYVGDVNDAGFTGAFMQVDATGKLRTWSANGGILTNIPPTALNVSVNSQEFIFQLTHLELMGTFRLYDEWYIRLNWKY